MNTQETNNRVAQAKPVKRVLTAAALRHLPGMVVKTNVKAGGMKVPPGEEAWWKAHR